MIIQDLDRAASLIRENKIRDPKTVIVPNGPLGRPRLETSDFFSKQIQHCAQPAHRSSTGYDQSRSVIA